MPEEIIPNAEELDVKDEKEMKNKLFPFSRMARGLPYPNVSLETVLNSLPSQRIS